MGDNRMLIIDWMSRKSAPKIPNCWRACSRRRAIRRWMPTSRTCWRTPVPSWRATAAIRCWPARWVACCYGRCTCGFRRSPAAPGRPAGSAATGQPHPEQSGAAHHGRRAGPGGLPEPQPFHAQFKDSVGLTPHQYLLKARLDRAARLLRETPLPLVRIAEECGFSSQSALTTATRRYLGLTPRGLRKSDR